jgi:hypothetical protein
VIFAVCVFTPLFLALMLGGPAFPSTVPIAPDRQLRVYLSTDGDAPPREATRPLDQELETLRLAAPHAPLTLYRARLRPKDRIDVQAIYAGAPRPASRFLFALSDEPAGLKRALNIDPALADFEVGQLREVPRAAYGRPLVRVDLIDAEVDGAGAGLLLVLLLDLYLGVLAAALWAVGRRIRDRETRILSVWTAASSALEVSLARLVYGTGYSRRQILDSLEKINSLGGNRYRLEPRAGLVFDERLSERQVLVRSCPDCGARIDRSYPLLMPDVPVCEFCGNPFDVSAWNALKLTRFEQIRAEAGIDPGTLVEAKRRARPFRRGVFALLVLFFWPAAIYYALSRSL